MKQIRDNISRREVLRQATALAGVVAVGGIWTPRRARAAFAPPPKPGSGPNRWALLVGVGDYQRTDVNWLLGPLNDVPAMRELLEEKYGFAPEHMKTLLNKEATRANLLAGWDWLVASAKPGDQVVFFFSGHGTRIKERVPGTHPGGYESALCPFDSLTAKDLVPGSEIGERIDKLKTDQVVVVVDACHSGFASRAPSITPRFIPGRLFGQVLPPKSGPTGQATRDGETAFSDLTKQTEKPTGTFALSRDQVAAGTITRKQKERCLGAARIDQSAADDVFLPVSTEGTRAGRESNPKMGALTYYLIQELRNDTDNTLTYTETNRRVRTALRGRYGAGAQEPQLSGPNVDGTPFLALNSAQSGTPPTPSNPNPGKKPGVVEEPLTPGDTTPPPSRPVAATATTPNIAAEVVKVAGKTVTLRGIAGANLVPGSILATVVASSGVASKKWVEAEDPVSLAGRGLVRITSAAGLTATGTVLTGTVGPGDRLTETLRGTPEQILRASLSGPASDAVRKAVDYLVTGGVLRLVSEQAAKAGGADAAIFADSNDKVTIYRGALPLPPLSVTEVPDQLRRLWAVKTLYELKNTDPKIGLTVTGDGQEGFADVAIGQQVKFAITPSTDCFLTILDLAADGKVTGKKSFAVKGGETLKTEAVVTAPVGVDVFKVFATKNPLQVALPETAADIAQMGSDSIKIARAVTASLRTAINNESGRGPELKKWVEEEDPAPAKPTPTTPIPNPTPVRTGVATDGWTTAELFLRIRAAG